MATGGKHEGKFGRIVHNTPQKVRVQFPDGEESNLVRPRRLRSCALSPSPPTHPPTQRTHTHTPCPSAPLRPRTGTPSLLRVACVRGGVNRASASGSRTRLVCVPGPTRG